MILDFGLVSELHDLSPDWSAPAIAGTVRYMSPGRKRRWPFDGERILVCAGSYAVRGAYRENRCPFDGTSAGLILAKQQSEAPRPSDFISGVPEDLDRLCVDLLRRERSARPDGSEVLRTTGRRGIQRASVLAQVDDFRWPGQRPHQNSRLHYSAAEGKPSIVLLRGASGVGKSGLVRHFLETIVNQNAIELVGRCYEQEAVPYRAVDSAIDSLSTVCYENH